MIIYWKLEQNRELTKGQFHRATIIQEILLYTMNPSKTARKSMGEWDYRTRIIPLLLSMKPAKSVKPKTPGVGAMTI
jgi:hypothetical protein